MNLTRQEKVNRKNERKKTTKTKLSRITMLNIRQKNRKSKANKMTMKKNYRILNIGIKK